MAEPRRTLWIPGSDWLIELVLVPVAMGTVFWALWHAAFLAAPGGQYGLGAGVLAGVWFLVLLPTDLHRYKNRAAILLVVPVILPVWVSWPAVSDAAMEYRGIVEECPVDAERTYEVTSKYGSHWETEYTLDCEYGSPEVRFTVDEPSATAEEYGYGLDDDGDDYDDGYGLDGFGGDDGLGDYGDDFDFGGSAFDDEPGTIEVEYDPNGLVGARTSDFATEGDRNADGALYFAAFLALVAIGIRLAAARSREHGA